MIAKLLAYPLRGIVTLLFWSLRIEIHGASELKKINEPALIAIWHNQLLLLPSLVRKFFPLTPISVLISNSRDGDIPAAFAATFEQVYAIRVSHKNRHSALLTMIDVLKQKHLVLLTPDGPKGPMYKIKPGVLFGAKTCGVPIITLSWNASRCIRLNSWDRFCIPLPFSKIQVYISEPLMIRDETDTQAIEDALNKALQ